MASVIVAGSTGAIGRTVVQHAIRQPSIQRVVALTRTANVTEAQYEQLFGIVTHLATAEKDPKERSTTPADVVMVTPMEAAKIQPVTMDWEAFATSWAAARPAAATATTPAAPEVDPLAPYKELFTGHTYAAMCLGTTRKEAGSADKFIRCDYDYVIAFTEAVLSYSAPAGFDHAAAYVHRIEDGTEVKAKASHTTTPTASAAAAPPSALSDPAVGKSTGTLRAFSQVSSAGADSGSWFLYMRTKGSADEATVERVHNHNKRAAAAGAVPPVLLFLLHPGLLQRHGKSRWNEKLAHVVAPSIPVETCGAAAVSAFVEQKLHDLIVADAPLPAAERAKRAAERKEKAHTGESTEWVMGKPFKTTKVMKKGGVPHDEEYPCVYELSNSAIKELAARLPHDTPTAEAP